MKENIEKPYYELYPSINCSGMVLVNDVPVFKFLGKDTEDGLMDGTVPINHVLLQSGKHRIVGKMYPRYGHKTLTENDGMSIDFNLSDFDRWKETKHSFFPQLNSPEAYFDEDNRITSPVKGLSNFEIATEIEVDLPFVLDGWQDSVDLSKIDKEELFQEVLSYYRQLHALLQTHNAPRFLELSKEKEDLQTKAFYFDDQRKEEIRQSILNVFNMGYEPLALQEEDLKIETYGYGKLVTLLRQDGTSALQFKRENEEYKRNIELEIKLHMRNEEKGLSII